MTAAWIALAVAAVAAAGWDVARRWIAARHLDDAADLRASVDSVRDLVRSSTQETEERLENHEDAIRNHKALLDTLQQQINKQSLSVMGAQKGAKR